MQQHTRRIIDELCNYLGHDFDDPMCKELHRHIQDCPECVQYIESIKLTISLCKEAYKAMPTPPEVKEKLLELLKLKM